MDGNGTGKGEASPGAVSLEARPLPPIWLLTAMTGLGPFTMQLMIPTLPALGRELAASAAAVQLVLTLYLIGVACGQLFLGPMSDRLGRRPVLLMGLVIYLLATVLAMLAPNIEALVVARIFQALGACSGLVLGRAIIRDVWPRDQAAAQLGLVMMGMTVAPMLAPLFGAWLQGWFGWRAALAPGLIFAPVLIWAVARHLPETLAARVEMAGIAGLLAAYAQALRDRRFRAFAATGAMSSGVFFAFMGGAPFVVMNGMGYSAKTYALSFMLISTIFGLGSFLASRYSTRLGTQRMLGIGLALTTLGSVAAVLTQLLAPPLLLVFFLPMTLVALGNGIAQPNTIAAAVSSRPAMAGTASGVLGAAQMLTGALMTLIVGVMESGTGIGTAAVMAACGISAQVARAVAQRIPA